MIVAVFVIHVNWQCLCKEMWEKLMTNTWVQLWNRFTNNIITIHLCNCFHISFPYWCEKRRFFVDTFDFMRSSIYAVAIMGNDTSILYVGNENYRMTVRWKRIILLAFIKVVCLSACFAYSSVRLMPDSRAGNK